MQDTTSQKQIDANRRNALKSTGPRTESGKAAAKRNALKHGILSEEVVLCGLHTQESQTDFDALRQRFWDELAPVGPMEEMLVDRIVTISWRMRRAARAEAGAITLNVDGSSAAGAPPRKRAAAAESGSAKGRINGFSKMFFAKRTQFRSEFIVG